MTHFTLMQVKLYVGAVSRATLPVSAPAAAEGPAEAAADATSKGGRKKSGSFFGLVLVHNFRSKNYHLLFLLPFDAETSKTCKNTIKLIHLCALPCLWLTLKVYFDLA